MYVLKTRVLRFTKKSTQLMKTTQLATLLFLFFGIHQTMLAKEHLPAIVLGLNHDTLHGEIKVLNAFDKGKSRAFTYLHFEINFSGKDGQVKKYQPGEILGFLIWTSDSTYEKFVSASLSPTAPEQEATFGKTGAAARWEFGASKAFVRVLDESGPMKLFAFYEEDVLAYDRGGMPPTLYNSLNERFLLQKGDGDMVKLNPKSKRRKVQLMEIFKGCDKIISILEASKLETNDPKVLDALVSGYNKSCGG